MTLVESTPMGDEILLVEPYLDWVEAEGIPVVEPAGRPAAADPRVSRI